MCGGDGKGGNVLRTRRAQHPRCFVQGRTRGNNIVHEQEAGGQCAAHGEGTTNVAAAGGVGVAPTVQPTSTKNNRDGL